MSDFSLSQYLKKRQDLINEYLQGLIPPEDVPPVPIHKSMHYSLMAGGKRLRPILAIAAAESVGADQERLLPFACAIEMIHTYSLIHDDLPAMDNDDLRRGRPTSHKVFGEAIAILAGDALLTHAFLILSRPGLGDDITAQTRLLIIKELAEASGSQGMIGGQVLDLQAQNGKITMGGISTIHRLKTGALIRASLRVGALAAGANEGEFKALSTYGEHLGLAFQITDDILDLEANEETLGKTKNSDLVNNKATYPSLLGIDGARGKAREAVDSALSALAAFDKKAEPLRHIAIYTITREK